MKKAHTERERGVGWGRQRKADRQTHCEKGTYREREVGGGGKKGQRKANRQTDRQRRRQTGRQTDRL